MDDALHPRPPDANPARPFLESVDQFRRGLGAGFDAGAIGRRETPFRTVGSGPALSLRRYGPESPNGPALMPPALAAGTPRPPRRAIIHL